MEARICSWADILILCSVVLTKVRGTRSGSLSCCAKVCYCSGRLMRSRIESGTTRNFFNDCCENFINPWWRFLEQLVTKNRYESKKLTLNTTLWKPGFAPELPFIPLPSVVLTKVRISMSMAFCFLFQTLIQEVLNQVQDDGCFFKDRFEYFSEA